MEEEVLWLHSLWHLGPHRNPSDHRLAIKAPLIFKKTHKKKKIIEWPCADPPIEAAPDVAGGWHSWGSTRPPRPATRKIPTCEEQAKFRAQQVQQKALCASKEFFTINMSSDDDDNEEDDDEDRNGEDTSMKLGFFLDLFEKDGELRDYYKKNYERGEFCCLVCVGMGEKIGKTFGDCVSLVQHANCISKTKGLKAHRMFAKVVCQVLGWDVNRLPTIVHASSGVVNHSSTDDYNSKQQELFNCLVDLPPNSLVPEAANCNSQGSDSEFPPVAGLSLNDKDEMLIPSAKEDMQPASSESSPKLCK